MTHTEELLTLAEAAYTSADDIEEFHYKANPTTIKQLVELVRLQHEALILLDYGTRFDEATGAIAAFNKFEGGEVMDAEQLAHDLSLAEENNTLLEQHIEQLRAETETLRKDAERYRFAKSRAYVGVNPHAKTCLWVLRGIYEVHDGDFDAAIDAAMKEDE